MTKQLILRVTNRCNLACKYCYAYDPADEGGDMQKETAINAIRLLAEPGDRLMIQFTGGEPLLCMALLRDIAAYTESNDIRAAFSLQTNGTLLTPDVCMRLKELRCAVGVSLDGIGEANGLRVYGSGREAFSDTVEGIRNLGEAGLFCNINAVVSRKNQNRLGELVELAGLLGNVKGLGLDMFRPLGRGEKEDYAPDMDTLPGDLEAMLQKQEELSSLGISVRIKELEKVRIMLGTGVRETCYCHAQTSNSLAVDPRGDIYPCSSFVGRKEMRMGNVEEGIKNSPAVPGPDEICRTCELAALCRGGCPAGRMACGGRNEADCMMHRTMIQESMMRSMSGGYKFG